MLWLIFLLVIIIAAWFWFLYRQNKSLSLGQTAPEFNLIDQHGNTHTLTDFRGKWVVLYFYPKDDTPGCTKQACGFRDELQQLVDLGAQVVSTIPLVTLILPRNFNCHFLYWLIPLEGLPHAIIR